MANFSVTNTTAVGAGNAQAATTTTYKTQIVANNSTTNTNTAFYVGTLKRGFLYDIMVGTNGTPADNYMEYDVIRITGGTSTPIAGGVSSVSSNLALQAADVAGFANVVGINSSIETAFTALNEVWYVGVNQRASYRWVAAPGSEIVWAANTSAVGNNGLSGRARSGSGYTGTVTMNWLFSE